METLFDSIYASRDSAASYPILVYIELLLIWQWHGLSGEQLEVRVGDRLSFRRSCGIPLDRPVPDHSSIWRFRQHLAALDAQLDARGSILRKDTPIDATIVAAAVNPPKSDAGGVSEHDPDAGFAKKNGDTYFG